MTAASLLSGPAVRAKPLPRVDETLWREAQGKIAPILNGAGKKGRDTVMFLALLELQKSYPSLRAHELEALLKYVMKQGDSR